MGLQNALYKRGLSFASDAAVEFNDEMMEAIAYYAYSASSDLAAEVGTYSTYEGSKWDRGLLPQDTIDLLEDERGRNIDIPRGGKMDWSVVRGKIAEHGMRNLIPESRPSCISPSVASPVIHRRLEQCSTEQRLTQFTSPSPS